MVLGLTNNMCRPRRVYQPHVRGKWRGSLPRIESTYSSHYTYGYPQKAPVDPNASKSVLNLPVYFNKYHGNLKAGFEQDTSDEITPRPSPLLSKKRNSKKCFITKLPMEILLQVAEYVVPTDTSYHVFPSTRERWGGARKTILHALSPGPEKGEEDRVKAGKMSPPRQDLTAMARSCRLLSEAYYEVMYGSNHFIIEISATDVFPSIEGPTSTRVESWTKLTHGKLRKPMWPLTENSIRYVKHLTILGTVHYEEKHTATTQGHFHQALQMLHNAQHLNDLTVDLRNLPSPVPYEASRSSQYFSSQEKPAFNKRLEWGVQGPDDTFLRLRKVDFAAEEKPGLAGSWDIFNNLRGVREVTLSGHINKEFADGLRTRMMSQVASEENGKTQKKSLKRKAAVESWSRVRNTKCPCVTEV